ncbi:MAG: ATP-binding protein [Acidobacteriota bacterium]|nr:ATP-binding protein [Acidobacteriota bacterium]
MLLSRTLRFRRRLFVAGVVVSIILLVTFYLVFRNSAQAAARNSAVAHSQEVLSTIARARLEPASLQNQVWAYRSSHDPELPLRFPVYLQNLTLDIRQLRDLTADNAAQRVVLSELAPILTNQMLSLQQAMQRAALAPDENSDLTFDWTTPTPLSGHVQRLFGILESNERALLVLRITALRDSTRRGNLILLAAATLTFAVLAFAGWLVSRELMTRADLHMGIGEAAGLLGVKFEDQRTKLSHAIKELNVQIRKRQRAEADLQSLNEELEKRIHSRTLQLQEANTELETFNHAVAHDLRAPLRHMEGFSHFLQKYGPGLPEEAQHYLDRIRSATTHMSSLVEGLLQLSHVGRQLPNLLPVSLRALFDDAFAKLQPDLLHREIEWRVGELPVVEGDPVLLAQVFTNLLSNALKFTRLQPHAVIEVGSSELAAEKVIFVRDNGVGFNSDYAAKLFGVFQRLHRQDEFEGTGIGLATVQRIIRRHGGRIWTESTVGQGATFFFTLPLSQQIVVQPHSLVGAGA